MSTGHLALILHAHLPFVRHPEHEEFLEEDWLHEAITETYIPLLAMMQRLVDDGVRFKLTMSLTPTLCSMLQDELLQARYIRYIGRAIALARQEVERDGTDAHLRELSRFYVGKFEHCRRCFVDEYNGDLLAGFRRLQRDGVLEIIGCAATHGYLPLLRHLPKALRAQIFVGRDQHRELFRTDPDGFWLPECGYAPELDAFLQEANIRWFVLDSHGLMFGQPRPRFAIYAPCYTPAGPAAFARERELSRDVWNATEGYPGDPAYRDFYRDAGFDLPVEQLQSVFPDGTIRKFTGLKYHRVTGREPKELYDPAVAQATAERHASEFVAARERQFAELAERCPNPVMVAPFDAELFGHWWYEGPQFLEAVIRAAANRDCGFRLTTPGEYLREHPTQQTITPAASSWGENGYSEMWLHESNAWIYPHLHGAAERMTQVARQFADAQTPMQDRMLKQLARELLLAQSSDWPFLMRTRTAPEYATQRVRDHLLRFNRLFEQLRDNCIHEQFLVECESRDNIFPTVNWRYYV
jgi:1,4-alpha-glucan branching enzyme